LDEESSFSTSEWGEILVIECWHFCSQVERREFEEDVGVFSWTSGEDLRNWRRRRPWEVGLRVVVEVRMEWMEREATLLFLGQPPNVPVMSRGMEELREGPVDCLRRDEAIARNAVS
jgi:hypothetical protein